MKESRKLRDFFNKKPNFEKFILKIAEIIFLVETLPLRIFIFVSAQLIFKAVNMKPIRINFIQWYDNCVYNHSKLIDDKEHYLGFGQLYMLTKEKEMNSIFDHIYFGELKGYWSKWFFIVAHEIAHYIQRRRHLKWYNVAKQNQCFSFFGMNDADYRATKIEANADKIAMVVCKSFGLTTGRIPERPKVEEPKEEVFEGAFYESKKYSGKIFSFKFDGLPLDNSPF